MPCHNLDTRIAIADLLIRHGADIDYINNAGDTVLDVVMDRVADKQNEPSSNVTRFVKCLIENGIEVNIGEERSNVTQQMLGFATPNMRAGIMYQREFVHVLMEKTARKESPLMKAVKARHEDITKLLINAGADVNYVGPNDNDALHFCILGSGKIIQINAKYIINVM